MSNYKCLAIEYPFRVLEAWEAHLEEERAKGRETSFTLACLSVSVGVVLELLGMVRSDKPPDPDRNPMGPFRIDPGRKKEFEDTWRRSFVGSKLEPADGSFRYRARSSPLNQTDLKAELVKIDNWAELSAPPASSPTCAEVLEIIRHASSHGGVYAGKSKLIERIVLVNFTPPDNSDCRRIACVAFSPAALEDLVRKWKALLHELLPVHGG